MAPVDPARVTKRDVLHDAGQGDVGNLDDQVDMVGHQAEGVHLVAIALDPLLEQEIEPIAVLVLEEDVLPAVASENHVVDGTGVMDAWFAGHGRLIAD